MCCSLMVGQDPSHLSPPAPMRRKLTLFVIPVAWWARRTMPILDPCSWILDRAKQIVYIQYPASIPSSFVWLLAVRCRLLAEILSLPEIATPESFADGLQIGLFIHGPFWSQEFFRVRITG